MSHYSSAREAWDTLIKPSAVRIHPKPPPKPITVAPTLPMHHYHNPFSSYLAGMHDYDSMYDSMDDEEMMMDLEEMGMDYTMFDEELGMF